MKRSLPLLLSLPLFASCAFHSTASQWNGRVGPNGNPVHLKSTTSVGLNLVILLRLFGATTTTSLVDELTGEIAEEGGDRVRIVQSSSENYWYGFPPFTWIVTPVVNTVTAEYEPTEEELEAARNEAKE